MFGKGAGKTLDSVVVFCYFQNIVKNNKEQEPITVGFVALGCPKNVVDSERMLAEIAQAKLLISPDPDDADVVVINTCGFISPAKAEALEAIKHVVACKGRRSVKKVIVAGCLAERAGKELFDEIAGIDAVVGLDRRDDIAEIILEVLHSDRKRLFVGQASAQVSGESRDRPRRRPKIHDDRTRLLITPQHWAYLRISEGCDHKCSFCTIPAIRGRYRSKPVEMVLAEAVELVSAGAVELNIIAQDTTNYGRDLGMKNGLVGLIRQLDRISLLRWVRLMYLSPSGISDELIETIAESEKVVHYLDVPIQHINDHILSGMRRSESRERICRLIEQLRSAIPDVVLRTTVILGFPGETDERFAELLDFVKWAKFDALGCFKYYPESGTAAAEMPGQIPDVLKEQRLDELMLAQQQIAFTGNENRIGSGLLCLVDSVDGRRLGRGRFYGQAPDIDSVCLIRNCEAAGGQFAPVRVIATKDYDLVTEETRNRPESHGS